MNVNLWRVSLVASREVAVAGHPQPAVELDGCCPSVAEAPLGAHEAEELADAFAALADPVRVRLLSIIASADGGEVCACDLVEPVGRSQPTVSHHLKVLHQAGLVAREKRGTWVWYRAVPERLRALQQALAPS